MRSKARSVHGGARTASARSYPKKSVPRECFSTLKLVFCYNWYEEGNRARWHDFVLDRIKSLRPGQAYMCHEVGNGGLGVMGAYESDVLERICGRSPDPPDSLRRVEPQHARSVGWRPQPALRPRKLLALDAPLRRGQRLAQRTSALPASGLSGARKAPRPRDAECLRRRPLSPDRQLASPPPEQPHRACRTRPADARSGQYQHRERGVVPAR